MIDQASPVSELLFVAFDFETTGLQAGHDSIVECGAVKFKNGKVIDTFQSLVNAEQPIPPIISQISGITAAMLVDQPNINQVLPDLLAFFGDAILIAHNADFDLAFLRAALLSQNLAPPSNLIIDTVALAKRAYPGQRSYSLQSLASFLNFSVGQAHRALDDAVTCMKLFEACAQNLSFMGDLTLAEVIA